MEDATYYSTIRSLYRHVVCNVPVSCKVNGFRNQLQYGLTVTLLAFYTSQLLVYNVSRFKFTTVPTKHLLRKVNKRSLKNKSHTVGKSTKKLWFTPMTKSHLSANTG